MKIVADENIPLLEYYFGDVGELVTLPGRAITRAVVQEADILLVRSVTRVDQTLLSGSRVRFVGSAVTGMDHLDTAWLTQAGIAWAVAKGCNKRSVMEYVVAVVAALQADAVWPKRRLRAGVIGVGEIGQLVTAALTTLGFDVVLCDPWRAAVEPDFPQTPLSAFADLDLVTVHVPLIREGSHPTYHLIQQGFLARQQKGCVLLNTSRGAVIDFEALRKYGEHLYWCLDVWEHEPDIAVDILALTQLATPHIAGYSVESKQRGIAMVYAAMGLPAKPDVPLSSPPCNDVSSLHDWVEVVLRVYDPRQTTAVMKKALVENASGATFDLLRKQFPPRYEFAGVRLENLRLQDADREILRQLGFANLF